MNVSMKKIENRSTFSEVMDNIIVAGFFDSLYFICDCSYVTVPDFDINFGYR